MTAAAMITTMVDYGAGGGAVGNDDAIKILPTIDEFLSAMTADPEKELFIRKVI